jgi:small neutral amino acid transporter SnatA (MarC family)
MTGLDTLGVSAPFVVIAVLAATNPFERRAALAALGTTDRRAVAVGALVALVAYAVAAAVATDLLDGLDVSPATARVAAGLVLAVRALLDLAGPLTRTVPERAGPSSGRAGGGPVGEDRPNTVAGLATALVPVAFPVLVRPELALVVVAFAASERAWWCLGAAAVGLALLVALPERAHDGRNGRGGRAERSAGQATAAVTAALAVATVIGGVLDL